jgi:hypothetical protein
LEGVLRRCTCATARVATAVGDMSEDGIVGLGEAVLGDAEKGARAVLSALVDPCMLSWEALPVTIADDRATFVLSARLIEESVLEFAAAVGAEVPVAPTIGTGDAPREPTRTKLLAGPALKAALRGESDKGMPAGPSERARARAACWSVMVGVVVRDVFDGTASDSLDELDDGWSWRASAARICICCCCCPCS